MKIKLSDIKPNPENPRTIKDDNFNKLVNSLKDFPVMTSLREVVLDEDSVIIGGNMRYRAAKEAGWKEIEAKIFTRELAELNNKLTGQDKTYEEYCEEFVIKDNISGGDWDWDILANKWDAEDLDKWGLELPGNYKEEPEIEEDEAPEVSDDPAVSIPGKIYQLGKHRVMCGSATSEEDTNKLLGQQMIDLYLTDPPYNVDYTGSNGLKIMNDKKEDGEFLAFIADSYRRADEHMKSGASFYIFHADLEGYNFRAALRDVGWQLRQNLIWVKNSLVMGRSDYHWKHEPILYGWKDGESHSWYTDRKQTTVLEFDKPLKNGDHPTMKPLNILAYLIQNSTKAGDLVFDNFLGSGSTLIACEQTDRICYGMELDPKYVDVIRKRYAKYIQPDNQLPENWEELTPEVN